VSSWITYARLQHAMRELHELEVNVSPRLRLLRDQLNISGAISESYEIENIRHYIHRMLEDANRQIYYHYTAIVPTIPTIIATPAPRTTPLLLMTDDDVYTS